MRTTPNVSVDVVLLTLHQGKLQVALHRRARAPFQDCLALPGGYVHVDKDGSIEATAYRVLKQKTGLQPRYLEQLRTFAGPQRDPRGWSVAISHVALMPYEELRQAGDEVFHFHDVDGLPDLAFDHAEQIREAVRRVRNKASYSTLPCWLLPELFTLTQLQRTYEQIFGETVSRGTFRSRLGIKVAEAHPGESADQADILLATDQFQGGSQRPARLFRVNQLSLFKRACW
ncbi:NUDIX hydrolase [Chromobacterium sphagni]|uniref:NUDIX hydrolase n=1 Tax=Chromobacterium sphagni TaxID=1903179 RepID=A0A1S1X1M6_9NEIS|nr:NUDIX domain-containing protein [Chromobacterium sphagni]OHX13437.1 NUDIX hydrolase [Chromobacterium sphagni]